ncbi:dihydroneopterin aldolase [Paramicrobacterium agarici]|uniref:dihydroneopterin aldolase n=1 Tax=Paramicrobacterium agarici TaxID=630514 RepID=UPI00116A2874|nr:dihydroneopterin aldolase [Microbacterium agarici]TQO23485.1 dihydroneopterin aldolase [Microbacterium agarici]
MNDSELDAITVTGIRVHAHHGVFDDERENGQEFVVDITVFTDVSTAGENDDLAHTVHYGELAEAVADAVSTSPVDLIETVAERVARTALRFARVQKTRVTLHKPHAPISVPFDDVSVTITRPEPGA